MEGRVGSRLVDRPWKRCNDSVNEEKRYECWGREKDGV